MKIDMFDWCFCGIVMVSGVEAGGILPRLLMTVVRGFFGFDLCKLLLAELEELPRLLKWFI